MGRQAEGCSASWRVPTQVRHLDFFLDIGDQKPNRIVQGLDEAALPLGILISQQERCSPCPRDRLFWRSQPGTEEQSQQRLPMVAGGRKSIPLSGASLRLRPGSPLFLLLPFSPVCLAHGFSHLLPHSDSPSADSHVQQFAVVLLRPHS